MDAEADLEFAAAVLNATFPYLALALSLTGGGTPLLSAHALGSGHHATIVVCCCRTSRRSGSQCRFSFSREFHFCTAILPSCKWGYISRAAATAAEILHSQRQARHGGAIRGQYSQWCSCFLGIMSNENCFTLPAILRGAREEMHCASSTVSPDHSAR